MTATEARAIEIDGQHLEYLLRRSSRRRTLEISVEPDQRVVVTAPESATDERIATAVRRKARWIRRQQLAFEDLPQPPPPRQWVSGETHRYLGRQYRLKVVSGTQVSVRLSGAFFLVTVSQPADKCAVQRAMEGWYRDHAKALLADRTEKAVNATTWLDLTALPPVIVRTMKQRWGSTTPSGRLYFNLDLVKLPLGCIDYVVMHELVHLKIPHHGTAFWRLLGRCMPDWERWRERLIRQEV